MIARLIVGNASTIDLVSMIILILVKAESKCYMDWLKFTRLYVTVTISVESRRLETDIVTVTYRRSEF